MVCYHVCSQQKLPHLMLLWLSESSNSTFFSVMKLYPTFFMLSKKKSTVYYYWVTANKPNGNIVRWKLDMWKVSYHKKNFWMKTFQEKNVTFFLSKKILLLWYQKHVPPTNNITIRLIIHAGNQIWKKSAVARLYCHYLELRCSSWVENAFLSIEYENIGLLS